MKIIQLPSGSFRTQLYSHTEDGKRKYKSITAPTKTEVKRLAAEFIANRDQIITEAKDGETLGELIDNYISSKNNILSPSTVNGYKKVRARYLPALMGVPYVKITPEMMQNEINALAADHSPKTVRNIWGLVSSSLAVKDVNIKITLPQKVKPDIEIPTEEEMTALYKAAEGDRLETAVYLASMCGMRRSEICALKWEDVDLSRGTLTIRAAMVIDDANNYVIKGTKTTSSKRTIKIFEPVLEKLKAAERSSDYVVPIEPNNLTHHFEHLQNRAGVRHFRFHDLRHYAVSVMLMLNTPKNYIADYVGHETERMIDEVYGHIMKGAKDDFLSRVDKYFTSMQHEMQHEKTGNSVE